MSATCGCCSGIHVETPRTVSNRPGLTAIAYRVGDWSSFRRSMHAMLTGPTPISRLTTRENDDFTIALFDAWAVASDVLTFYQERIANESYLRTAGERLSVLELARLIGYELAPGVASSVWLAFSVDDSPGAPGRVRIDAGSRAQSVPGQDEEPQTFETSTTFEARVEWNELRPALAEKRGPKKGETSAYFAGTDTRIQFGDGLIFPRGDMTAEFRRVIGVKLDHQLQQTRVTWAPGLDADAVGIRVTRVKAPPFGYNAPKEVKSTNPLDIKEWTTFTLSPLDLDGVHDQIEPQSWIVMTAPGETPQFLHVSKVEELIRTDFTITGKITQLTLHLHPDLSKFVAKYRFVTVFGASEELPMAGYPLAADMPKNDIPLDRAIPPLPKNRPLLVTGIVNGKPETEIAYVDEVRDGGWTLRLITALPKVFKRSTVRIFGNVAEATHGESVREVLGSGDAAVPFQRFRLSHAPLTYTQAPWEADGAASTLQIFVNDIRWNEVSSLYGRGPNARVYVTRRNDDGHTWVQFGDGKTTGARLPTGVSNVRAVYRKTMGLSGNVDARKVTMLMSRPLGLGGVTNPIPARGGDGPEELAGARTNAPRTVLTLDRVVSLHDYEAFATAYAGVAKAVATWTWSGTERQVFLTVAGPGGMSFAPDDPTLSSLTGALRLHGHPYIPIRVVSYVKVLFDLSVKLGIDSDRVAEIVFPQVREAVEGAFAFESRNFGEAVDLSDVVKVIHSVPGVASVDIDVLRRNNVPGPARNERLTARLPQQDEHGNLIPAEILVLGPFAMQEAQ